MKYQLDTQNINHQLAPQVVSFIESLLKQSFASSGACFLQAELICERPNAKYHANVVLQRKGFVVRIVCLTLCELASGLESEALCLCDDAFLDSTCSDCDFIVHGDIDEIDNLTSFLNEFNAEVCAELAFYGGEFSSRKRASSEA